MSLGAGWLKRDLTSGVLLGSQVRRENKRQQHEQQGMTMAA
jgi:hypothetical protein